MSSCSERGELGLGENESEAKLSGVEWTLILNGASKEGLSIHGQVRSPSWLAASSGLSRKYCTQVGQQCWAWTFIRFRLGIKNREPVVKSGQHHIITDSAGFSRALLSAAQKDAAGTYVPIVAHC